MRLTKKTNQNQENQKKNTPGDSCLAIYKGLFPPLVKQFKPLQLVSQHHEGYLLPLSLDKTPFQAVRYYSRSPEQKTNFDTMLLSQFQVHTCSRPTFHLASSFFLMAQKHVLV